MLGNPGETDLAVRAIEVTQGVQDWENRIPLVAGRWTAVRVYMWAPFDPPLNHVTGALGGWRGNQFLGVLYPQNDPITVQPLGGDRINLDDSLYYYLPPSWRSGTVKLKAVAYQTEPDTMQFETDSDNNYREVTVTFNEVDPLYVRLVPMHLHEDPDPESPETTFTYEGNEDLVNYVMSSLFRYMPINALWYDPGLSFPVVLTAAGEEFEYTFEGPAYPSGHAFGAEFDLTTKETWGEANAPIAWLKSMSAAPWSNWFWYGMIPESQDTGSYTGMATSGVSSGKMGWESSATSPWWLRFGMTIAHELGHVIMPGSDHILCKGTEEAGGGLDNGYPYIFPDCSMAAVDPEGFYGFDVYWSLWSDMLSGPTVISNDPSESEPNRGFPMMGYQRKHWADPYGYCKLLVGMGVPCDTSMVQDLTSSRYALVSAHPAAYGHAADVAGPTLPPVVYGQASGAYALIAASLDASSPAGTLLRLQPSGTAPAAPVEASRQRLAEMDARQSGLSLVFVGRDGTELARHPVADLAPVPHEEAVAPEASPFVLTEWFPWPSETVAVELRAGTRVLDRLEASAGAPTVTLLSPNGGPVDAPIEIAWDASDPDGDDLVFDLLYSSDGGANWRAIVAGISGHRATLPTLRPFSGSTRGVLKVVASDGFHSAEDVSDAFLTVPDSPPSVSIGGPAENARFPYGATVVLQGSAFDPEEFGLPGDSLRWESDRDGALGTGNELMTNTLSIGEHQISLVATDGAGNEGRYTVTITIVDGPGPKNRDAATEREILELFGVTTAGGGGGLGASALIGAGAAAVAIVLGGAGWFWRRRTRPTN